MTSKILFTAKTPFAYSFRIIVDTLNFYLKKKACFVIYQKGLYLCNTNEKEDVLCDVYLPSENFQDYKCFRDGDICFSVNIGVFYTEMLKMFKKKDFLHMLILEEEGKTYLKIIKMTRDSGKESQIANRIPITESKQITVNPPTGYKTPIPVISSVFTTSCRGITKPTSKQMSIVCYNGNTIVMKAKKDDIVENEVTLGGTLDETIEPVVTFKCNCSAAYVVRLAKMAASSGMVKMFMEPDLPVYYKMDLTGLGTVGIYIKTSEQVRSEQDTDNQDEDD